MAAGRQAARSPPKVSSSIRTASSTAPKSARTSFNATLRSSSSNYTGRGGKGIQLAFAIFDSSFRQRRRARLVNDRANAAHLAGRVRQRAHEVDLEFERRVDVAGGERAVDRAAHR